MIEVKSNGDFNKTRTYLNKLLKKQEFKDLDKYGQKGVAALSSATPIESGLTANSWKYKIIDDGKSVRIDWYNTNVDSEGTPIAILLQYGHGTGTGGYVPGIDFINPAIKPIFDEIIADIWREVKS